MNQIEHPLLVVDRLSLASDWLNPILVKEARQALKSRAFVITFMLLLLAAWLATLFGMLLGGEQLEYRAVGREFFLVYYYVLCVAVLVIVPFGAFRALLNERDYQTYELLSITTLIPRQIVWGKLNGAVLQVFIFYSAITPFIAFTALMEGFDIVLVSFLLFLLLMTSISFSMAGLMLSTLSRQRHWQALVSMAFLGFLVCSLFFYCASAGSMMYVPIPFDSYEFWWGFSWSMIFCVTYVLLFQQIAVAQLTFESDNRSTGLRIMAVAQFWIYLLMVALFCSPVYNSGRFTQVDSMLLNLCSMLSALHWSVMGLFFIAEPEALSRRITRRLPRWLPLRLLLIPFLPGGSRGLWLLGLHLLVMPVIVLVLQACNGIDSPERHALELAVAIACYIWLYANLGVLLGRWAIRSWPDLGPAHVRVFTLILFAAGCILPFFPTVFWSLQGIVDENPLLYITNPFLTLDWISRNRGTGYFSLGIGGDATSLILLIVAVMTLLATMLNLRFLLRGIASVMADSPATPVK